MHVICSRSTVFARTQYLVNITNIFIPIPPYKTNRKYFVYDFTYLLQNFSLFSGQFQLHIPTLNDPIVVGHYKQRLRTVKQTILRPHFPFVNKSATTTPNSNFLKIMEILKMYTRTPCGVNNLFCDSILHVSTHRIENRIIH